MRRALVVLAAVAYVALWVHTLEGTHGNWPTLTHDELVAKYGEQAEGE